MAAVVVVWTEIWHSLAVGLLFFVFLGEDQLDVDGGEVLLARLDGHRQRVAAHP